MTSTPANMPFIHLRCHSAFSLSKGAVHPKELVKLAKAQGMPAVALTDSGNLFGAMEFARYATPEGVQPIVGAELRVCFEASEPTALTTSQPACDTLVLLAQSEAGYENLLHLVSQSFLQTEAGQEPQVSWDDLKERAEDLIALTGGPDGPLNTRLAEEQLPVAEKVLTALQETFKDRLYIEIQRHFTEDPTHVEAKLIDLAYKHSIPLVATNNVFFDKKEFFEAHTVLLCIGASRVISDPEKPQFTEHHYFKSDAEMRALFKDIPEAIENTSIIARRCAFMPEARKPLLPPFPCEMGQNEEDELRKQAEKGLEKRFAEIGVTEEDGKKPYIDRLKYELEVIVNMGFPGYFLIVADFIQWAKGQGIPVGPGRGSGAGSVAAWALTITDLDPLRFGLLFERFLNPERVSMPDFDIDFCQERRDEVIRYVQNKYGHEHVAQIITFGKLASRAVLRDVGRVLEMPYGQVDRIAKLVPNNPANPVTLAEAVESEPQLQEMQRQEEEVDRLITIALQLEGLYRHASTHAAGVVIGDRPLSQLIPLYRDPRSDLPVTQFNMKDVEQAGLVKFDFLGLKTLTVISKACQLIAQRGKEIDINSIPLDDEKTFSMLARGETVGVFQLESAGMRDVLTKLKADKFEEIIAVVSLYRPGPMDNIPRYINVKHGVEQADYLYPSLEPILKETNGIMIYQEQVMQIAQVLSGYSLGGADLLRRAMGKKIQAEMDAQRKTFVDGAVKNNVPQQKASEIFNQVDKFAGYGFNKSHAAAYALVAYQTAWLKANYPHEFMAASMSLDKGNTDKLNIFRQELLRMGIEVRPVDINASEVEFAVEDDAIRYALAALKGVGAAAMEALVAERQANGPFKDLFDFAERLDSRSLNKRMVESLVKAGAFDNMEANRAKVFENIDFLLKISQAASEARESNQISLFGGESNALPEQSHTLKEFPSWPALEKLAKEFEAVGFYLSSHPLDAYEDGLTAQGVMRSADLLENPTDRPAGFVKLAGVVTARKIRRSAKGSKYAFITLSDTSGVYEVTAFSEAIAQAGDLLEVGTSVIVTVEVQTEEEGVRLTIQRIQELDDQAMAMRELTLPITKVSQIQHLQEKLKDVRPGRGTVTLEVSITNQKITMVLPEKYNLTPSLKADLA